MRALTACGWEVSRPLVPEVYDLVGRDPLNGEFKRIQVKTVRVREDRGGALVIYAKKSNGIPYSPEEVDYIAGVLGNTVYLMECRGIGEYWAQDAKANERWIEITAEFTETEAVV